MKLLSRNFSLLVRGAHCMVEHFDQNKLNFILTYVHLTVGQNQSEQMKKKLKFYEML